METETAAAAFAALSQPTRLDTLRLLMARAPRGVPSGEIAAHLGVRPNTMSTNLAVLTGAGLLRADRDGRVVRYAADVPGVQRLLGWLLRDCCGGAPELCQPAIDAIAPSHDGSETAMQDRPFNVLFLCTANSARSILAEAILKREGIGRFNAYSAGSMPSGTPHPFAVELLQKMNHDVSFARSKSWDEFAVEGAPELDFVFTVCDNAANEVCPVWPGAPMTAHWGVPDPANAEGGDSEKRVAFAETYRMLTARISAFVNLPMASLDRLALQRRLTGIGQAGATA